MITRYSLTRTLRHGPFFSRWSGRSGVALVIVLMFVVLLTGLVLVLLSRALSNGLISGASSNGTRTDLYARGSVEQIIGDLRQEIADGSTPQSVGSTTIYQPGIKIGSGGVRNYATVVPYLAGPSSYGLPTDPTSVWYNPTKGLLNVVKESVNGAAFYSGANYTATGPKRAAPVSTTAESARLAPNSVSGTSLNGRYVSVARWNKALLLLKANASISGGTGGTATKISDISSLDTTPTTSFIAPDWIFTAADGSNPQTFNAATMTDPKQSGYVVGRYAYTIYNEGGLLDANAAGSPSTATSTMTAAQQTLLSKKGPQAFADLTQVPGIANVTALKPQAIVDQLVAWRNYSTVQPTDTFPSYVFGNIDNYFNYILGSSTRFMTTGNTSLYKGQGDQIFSSRQQMISFFQDIVSPTDTKTQALLQDAMMYFTHFSRTLNQPSYWPDPKRPLVKFAGYPGTGSGTTSPTGNDDNGKDTSPTIAGCYNPAFKNIRVGTNGGAAFIRNDGTSAAFGDPLVKKRFALNRLAWISYKGALSTLNAGDALFTQYTSLGIPTALVNQWKSEGTLSNIKKYFGLSWTVGYAGVLQPGGFWVYDPDGDESTSTMMIKTLDSVAKQNREPNFFELLKAAICAGSVAKAGLHGIGQSLGNANLKYLNYRDSVVDYQIFQIGANIIAQASPANYPTQIVVYNNSNAIKGKQSFFGVADFPYFYATTYIVIENAPPSPNPPVSGSPYTPGKVVVLQVPIVWNPHSPGASPYPAGLTPTKFRIGVSTAVAPAIGTFTSAFSVGDSAPAPFNRIYAPWGTQNSAAWPQGPFPTSGTVTSSNGYGTTGTLSSVNKVSTIDGYAKATGLVDFYPVSSNDTEIYFDADTAGNTTLFREPTPLMYSTGSGTSTSGSGTYLDASNVLATVGGFSSGYVTDALNVGPQYLGFFIGELPLCWNDTTTPTTIDVLSSVNGNNDAGGYGTTYSLEYQVGATWIPYQQNNLHGLDQQNPFYRYGNTATSPSLATVPSASGSILPGGTNNGRGTAVWDPRTVRWGYSDLVANFKLLTSYAASNTPPVTLTSLRSGTGTGSSQQTGVTMGGVSKDSWLNLATIPFTNTGNYVIDADSIVRPPMAAYVLPIANQTATSATGLPMATVYTGKTTTGNASSRPIILHRPFRSVAELGYVFSDTPWRNIDFFTPESGSAALLDTFCINEDTRPDALTAGQVDLNTRQSPVIQALLAGTYRDETDPTGATIPYLTPPSGTIPTTATEAAAISQALVNRTTGVTHVVGTTTTATGPLSNIADLVGRYTPGAVANPNNSTGIGEPYDGFSADLVGNPTPGTNSLYSTTTASYKVVQRFLETTMRALSDAGQAGTWNLMIDLVAQTGRYPATAANAANPLAAFLVEGERHYWVHLAIDRQTGQVIDENIEMVNE